MKTTIHHVQLNVSKKDVSFSFYKRFLGYWGFKVSYEDANVLGMSDGSVSFWLEPTGPTRARSKYHRKHTGINHIALRTESKEAVDTFKREFLDPEGIVPLYNSPRIFSEYSETYYAVYFEDPDRIKLEIVSP